MEVVSLSSCDTIMVCVPTFSSLWEMNLKLGNSLQFQTKCPWRWRSVQGLGWLVYTREAAEGFGTQKAHGSVLVYLLGQ